MPRLRHVRLAAVSACCAFAVAFGASAPGAPQVPGRPGAVAAAPLTRDPAAVRGGSGAAPALLPGTRLPGERYRSAVDPDGARTELGAPRPPSPSVLGGYVWPLPHARLTLGFEHTGWGSRLVDGELFHDGIDLATFCGDRIFAAHDGVVLAAGRRYDRFMGWQGDLKPYFDRLDEKKAWLSLPIVVVIDDGNGYRSIYAHFRDVVVEPGQRVAAGDLLGHEGDTGRASGCHLHYGLFSPLEPAVFEIAPRVVKMLKVPRYQTARVDPRLVLPEILGPDMHQTERPEMRLPASVPELDDGTD